MASVWRVAGRVVAWLAILIPGLMVGAIAINSFDENLTPDTEALLLPPPNHYTPAENVYVALAGFDAPSGQSVIETGQARIATYNKKIDAMSADPLAGSVLTETNPQHLAFSGNIDFCHPQGGSYLSQIPNHKAELNGLFTDNREIYQRYLGLHRQHGYYETVHPSYLAPFFYVPNQVRCLFLADFAIRMQSGSPLEQQKAIADFEDDVQLWRLVLIGNGALLSKMIAVASLQADYLMLMDIIANPHTQIDSGIVEGVSLVALFAPSDWKIGNAYATEFRLTLPLWTQMQNMASGKWASHHDPAGVPLRWWHQLLSALQGPFFKLNATENLSARQMNLLIEMANSDPQQFNQGRDHYRNWMQKNESLLSLRLIFNPIGKILVAIAAPTYEDYAVRVYDCAALQRLARLGYEIRRQSVIAAAIPTFLERHPEWATHPLDGRLFLWNAQSGEITVQTLGKQSVGRRFTIQIWQPPPSGT